MEWLYNLFFDHTALQAVIILSLIIAIGLGLGKLRAFGVSLGVTFVFSPAFWPAIWDSPSTRKC